jgi:hypothetical protein
MSWEELAEKFRDCARLVLSRQKAEDAIRIVENLERMPNISPLLQSLAGGKPARSKRGKKGKK